MDPTNTTRPTDLYRINKTTQHPRVHHFLLDDSTRCLVQLLILLDLITLQQTLPINYGLIKNVLVGRYVGGWHHYALDLCIATEW